MTARKPILALTQVADLTLLASALYAIGYTRDGQPFSMGVKSLKMAMTGYTHLYLDNHHIWFTGPNDAKSGDYTLVNSVRHLVEYARKHQP